MHYTIVDEKVILTHESVNKERSYELEQIISIVDSIDKEHAELLERIADNRARYAHYSAMIPFVEKALAEKEARIAAEKAAEEEAARLAAEEAAKTEETI